MLKELEIEIEKIANQIDIDTKQLDEILFDRENYEIKIADFAKEIEIKNEEKNDFIKSSIKYVNEYEFDLNNSRNIVKFVSHILAFETIYRTNYIVNDDFVFSISYAKTKLATTGANEFLDYILCLAKYGNINNISGYKDFYLLLQDKFKSNSEIFDNYPGIINLYCESIANYYENNLDKIKDNYTLILDAKNTMKGLVDKTPNDKIYHKFYLTLGRLYSLVGEYEEGVKNIKKAIEKITFNSKRDVLVKNYQQFLILNTTIKAYNNSDNKIETLEEMTNQLKVDNIKALSILAAILGFVLGEISVFSNASSTKEMFVLMFTYGAIILSVIGIALLGIELLLLKRKKKNWLFIIIDLLMFIAGLLLTIRLYVKYK